MNRLVIALLLVSAAWAQGAWTEVYVDPSIAANSGTGTSGDPYGDLQYALDQQSHDAVNGKRFNIKAGTAESLSSALSFVTYGTSTYTAAAPLVFQGYTSAAGDGGIGAINSGTTQIVNNTGMDHLYLIDMDCQCTGSVLLFSLDNDCKFINVELHGSTSTTLPLLDADNYLLVVDCHFHTFAGKGVSCVSNLQLRHSWFESTSNVVCAVECGVTSVLTGNVVNISHATPTGNGFEVGGNLSKITWNTIYANGSTGDGVTDDATASVDVILENNVIVGWGVGSDIDHASSTLRTRLNNLYYDCTTADGSTLVLFEEGNTTAGADPFTDSANGDFSLVSGERAGAFPTTFLEGTLNYRDQGALQHQDAGGGGGGKYGSP